MTFMRFSLSLTASHGKRNRSSLILFRNQFIIFIGAVLLVSPVQLRAQANYIITASSAPLSRVELEKTRVLIQEIKNLEERLNDVVLSSAGTPIPRLEKPAQVIAIINELEKVMKKSGIDVSMRPEHARKLILSALQLLYTGRGHTQSYRDKTGWYPSKSKGPNGLAEIEEILSRGLLDNEGKTRFSEFVKAYNYNSDEEKVKLGFRPDLTTHTDEIKNDLLNKIKIAPLCPTYVSVRHLYGNELNLAEIIARAVALKKLSEVDARSYDHFIEQIEANHFDKSVRTLIDPSKTFVQYFGRETELQELLNALSKLDKGHVLLTGKAGVGKTTLIKMLSDSLVQGKLKIRDEQAPIILELPLIAVVSHDPSMIKSFIKATKYLSKAIDRRIILYVDEAHVSSSNSRNAMKSFLSTMIEPIPENSKVHIIFATTSQESRAFLADSAFSRRFTEVNVPEFNREQTIQLMKQTYEPIWKRYHKKHGYYFTGISDDAYEYAYRYSTQEQPHAGNPTGTKEILEAAIVSRMNSRAGTDQGGFRLEAQDIQIYIRDHLRIPLVPGDPEFENKFQERWTAFSQDYVGNEGVKDTLEDMIRSHFGQMNKNKMSALVNFGPPGGGKSYGAEMIAKHFFDNAMLTINGAEFTSNGSASINKLIGSTTGYVGSEEQRAILTKFIIDHPQGGVIKIEEADYLHEDVIRLFTNMITDKKFMDGLGKEWNTSKYILWMNSNLGQDVMIPIDARNKMDWEQFNTRRRQGTEKFITKDGKESERIKPQILDEVFEQFVRAIVTQSNPDGDTSSVSQEAQKQKRRYKAIYTLPPNRADLIEAAHSRVARYIKEIQNDYGIQLEISLVDVDRIIDIDHYQFEKGYSYVIDQLEDKLFRHLTAHLHERGNSIQVAIEDYTAEINGIPVPSYRLLVQVQGHETTIYPLGVVDPTAKNPWGDNPDIMDRIRNLSTRIHSLGIRGNEEIIHRWKAQLKLKASDWNTRVVFSLIGTSGNGKTERFKSLAKALYNNDQAIFTISGITSKYDLSRFFRPPMGIQGGKEQTDLERWFLSRQKAGGGVILFDELLSFAGLSPAEVASRLEAFNELYDLLDEGYVRFGSTRYDARGFVIGITGNSLQEAFDRIGDDPDSEKLVEKIKSKISQKEILDYFSRAGMDPPKVARLGIVDVLGPQPKAVTLPVAKAKLAASIEKIQKESRTPLEISVDDAVLQSLIERVTTAKLGMRQVNRAFDDWVKGPLNAIRSDFPRANRIEMKLDEDKKTHWFVDGKEVGLEGSKLSDTAPEERNWSYVSEFGSSSANRTPQLEDLPAATKLKYTEETLHAVATHELYGHWMTEVLLKRKNPADAISLIAGENYLGYVRPSEEELYHISHLSNLIKKQIMLQAGHRAVFLRGQYATGGGHGGSARDPKDSPSDDIGKIDRIHEIMINNRILPDLSETSPNDQKQIAKFFLNDLLDEMADHIIQEGIDSGEFKPLYDQLIQLKYLGKEELDRYIEEKVDFSKFGSADEYFMKQIRKALKSVNDRWNLKKAGKNYAFVKSLSQGILERLEKEAQTKMSPQPIPSIPQAATCDTVFEFLGTPHRR